MPADYTQWPTGADVFQRLIMAGFTSGIYPRDMMHERIPGAIDDVTAEVARLTLRQFVADTVDHTRTYSGTGTAEMEIDEIVSLTSIAVVGIQSAPGYTLTGTMLVNEQNKPQTRIVVARGSVPAFISEGVVVPYPSLFPAGRMNIEVTGRFGYGATIPMDLWSAVCGEIAHRVLSEFMFSPTGRTSMWKEGDEEERYQLSDISATGWHDLYTTAISNYKRPSGRRLRNMRNRMV